MDMSVGKTPLGGIRLQIVPREWPNTSGVLQELDFRSNIKFRTVSPGQRRPLAVENLPAITEGVQGNWPSASSRLTKWMPHNTGLAPTTLTGPTTLLDEVVPDGSRFWLESAFFNLAPTAREANYYWTVQANGIDIFNYGSLTSFPGRPLQAGIIIPLGFTRDQQVCLPPGTRFQVVVVGIVAAANTDAITATLIGSLEGVGKC